MESLGRRIAGHRAKLGWTQQALADRIGISRVAVAHLESGKTEASERTVALLAGVFHAEPLDLVAGTNYPMAKVERLPVVTARYTEVEHQIALLERDVAWIGDLGSDYPAGTATLDMWASRLRHMRAASFDPHERDLIDDALTIVKAAR